MAEETNITWLRARSQHDTDAAFAEVDRLNRRQQLAVRIALKRERELQQLAMSIAVSRAA